MPVPPILFLIMLVAVPPLKVTAEDPVPVVQDIPTGCKSIRDCPDYFGVTFWYKYQKACCRTYKGPKYHCQQTFVKEDGGHTNLVLACVWPKTCSRGNYAHVKLWTQGGLKYAEIECLSCTHDRFQPYPQDSVEFRYANCSNVFQPCLREKGLVLVTTGNATHDNYCRCWWEGGYKPDQKTSLCVSRRGFSRQDDCQCEPVMCPDGQALNQDFVCVQQPSTTTTSTTTTTPPTTTLTSTGKNQASGAPITAAIDFLSALAMAAALIIFI